MSDIAYEGRGLAGIPVLLVHGFPLDRTLWHGQLEGLGVRARAVALDLPGFGASPVRPDDFLSMDDLAHVVLEVADGLGFARFALVGLSMGGYVALALSRAHPERILALGLIDTRAEPDDDTARAVRAKNAARVAAEGTGFLVAESIPMLLGKRGVDQPHLVAATRAMLGRADPRAVIAALAGLAARPDARPALGGISCPTAVIVGADDRLTPPPLSAAMAAAIPGATLSVVPDAGHLSPLEQPGPVTAALHALLDRVG